MIASSSKASSAAQTKIALLLQPRIGFPLFWTKMIEMTKRIKVTKCMLKVEASSSDGFKHLADCSPEESIPELQNPSTHLISCGSDGLLISYTYNTKICAFYWISKNSKHGLRINQWYCLRSIIMCFLPSHTMWPNVYSKQMYQDIVRNVRGQQWCTPSRPRQQLYHACGVHHYYYGGEWDGYWVSIIWIMRWIQIVKIVGEILVPGVFLIVVDRFLHTWWDPSEGRRAGGRRR